MLARYKQAWKRMASTFLRNRFRQSRSRPEPKSNTCVEIKSKLAVLTRRRSALLCRINDLSKNKSCERGCCGSEIVLSLNR
jgi:hypothetical protein